MGICILHLLKKLLNICFCPDGNEKANEKKKEKKVAHSSNDHESHHHKIFDDRVIHLMQL